MQTNKSIQEQIDDIAKICQEIKPLVTIRCITYNHEQYIRDALEGFVMQKTDFPFVAIVHDDASTDSTAAIIREYADKYPTIIMPIYEIENQYSKGLDSLSQVVNKACEITNAKYYALCEGDDYWTDPLKLQFQVKFMESNPEYGLCYGRSYKYNQVTGKICGTKGNNKCSFKEIVLANCIPTATTLFKSQLFNNYQNEIEPTKKNWKMGDKPMWLWFSLNSKIHYFDSIFAMYRIVPNSASHFNTIKKWLEFLLNAYDISLYFIRIAGIDASFILPNYYFYKVAYFVTTNDKKSIKEYQNLLKPYLTRIEKKGKERILLSSMFHFPVVTTMLVKLKFKIKTKFNNW